MTPRSGTKSRFTLLLLWALLLSTWFHESWHIIAYWIVAQRHAPIVVHHWGGVAFSVTVPNPRQAARMVALWGPSGVGLLGVGLIAWGTQLSLGELVAVGVSFAVHLVGLLPGCSDGNRVWGLDEP